MSEGTNKALEIAKEAIKEYKPALEALSTNVEIPQNSERPFYRFFAIDYLATGEGRSYWLMICRNYQGIGGKDREKEKFINFIGMSAKHYMECFEELTEEEFMKKYDTLVPHNVKMMIHRRDQPAFTWETYYYFNYS
jgi:hypothetical protein